MAHLTCNFFSDTLQLSTSMTVILPQNTETQIGMKGVVQDEKFKTLWLLHGFSDDHTIWSRRTSIERYVASLGLAVIMPQVDHSYYTDMKMGKKYWTFVSEELPRIARSFFPLSDRREDNFAAGLSMGGYGAFKLGLRCPDQFAAVCSLSGALDVKGSVIRRRADKDRSSLYTQIFGDQVEEGEDLLVLAEKAVKGGITLPRMLQICGTEDFLYKDNIKFRDHCQKLGINLNYKEEQGVHEWGFWDRNIQVFLDWLEIA
jgi:putative tributyrin esterase